jgi:glycosyltransferase involved in cell wall biosynthesis
MNIDILIATYNDSIYNLKDILLPQQDGVNYKIAHQITNDKNYDDIDSSLANRSDVTVRHFFDKGLSKNRNHLLDMAEAQICLIMDDDVSLVPNIANVVQDAFKRHYDADIITFQTISDKRVKSYSEKAYTHTIKTLTQVSSIEVAFRLSVIKQHHLKFDTDFGIGATYEIGEEFIFLVDAYNKGLKLFYEPKVLATHEDESSGYGLSDEVLYARGAVYMRVFGYKSIALYIFSTIKHFYRYKPHYTPWRYFYMLLQGGLSYAKECKYA